MRRLLLLLAASFALAGQLFAHDPGLSSADVLLNERSIRVVLTFNTRDLESVSNDSLEMLARAAVEVLLDGTALAPQNFAGQRDANGNSELIISYARASARELTFRSLLLPRLPFGHRQAFAVRDSEGRELTRRLLGAKDDAVSVVLGDDVARSNKSSLVEFVFLGVRHILTGYDHLLFLFGLLIMCRNARAAAMLITCFTVAHSVTLALATFDLVSLQSRIVESAIAASILYVGIENLIYRERAIPLRWILTFAFGLVHGLGFASVLREMGVAKNGAAAVVPLLGFNAGVELGQLSVAAIVLPLIWALRRNPAFIRVGVPACSAIVAAAGASWLVARSFF